MKRQKAPLYYLPWGGEDIPARRLDPHSLLVGMTGSGKTLSVRMLMRAALLNDLGQLRARAIVYDPKLEFFTLLRSMGVPETSIVNLNPFDSRSVAWEMASDVVSYANATHTSSILIPDDENASQPFFNYAGQDIISAIIRTLIKYAPSRPDGTSPWGLHDVLAIATSPSLILHVLAQTGDGRDVLSAYFQSGAAAVEQPKTLRDIVATIRAKAAPFIPLATIWARHRQEREKEGKKALSIGFHDWLTREEPSVLLLGRDEDNARGLDALNLMMFRKLFDAILAQPESDTPIETWLFLDEARLAGALDGLPELLLKGRSRGIRVVLALQDIEGFRAVYGENEANEIFGMCGNIAIHKVRNPGTTQWACELFGSHEWYVRDFGHSASESFSQTAGQGASSTRGSEEGWSTNWKLTDRKAFLPQEFSGLPQPTRALGLRGIHMIPTISWGSHADPDFLAARLDELGPRARAEYPGFVPRQPGAQDWFPFGGSELKRLGISPLN